MRILHLLSQTELTGAEVYAQNLIQSQVENQHQVFVISDRMHVELPVPWISRPISTKKRWQRFLNIQALRKFLIQEKIDVIHCHSRGAVRHAYWARFGLPVALVTTFHGRQHFSWSKRLLDIYGEIRIAICENVKTAVEYDFKAPASAIRILRNPISILKSSTTQPTPRRSLRIALIGRSSGPKGRRFEQVALHCFEKWLALKPDLEISIIAPHPERFSTEVQHLIQSLNEKHPGQIQLLGRIENLRQTLREFDLVLGSGRIAIESLIEQVPIYALGEHSAPGLARAANFPECLASNFGDIGAYELEKPLDLEKLCAEISHFIQGSQISQQEREFLQQKVCQEFNAQRIHAEILDIYRAAIFKRHAPQWIPILMYHKIPDQDLQSRHRIFVTRENFKKHLKFFSFRKFQTLTFADLKEFWFGKKSWREFPRRPLLLTFDDGYTDNLSNAQPLLKEFGFRAVIYLLGNHQILENSWDADTGEKPYQLMSLDQKKQLDPAVWEIGSHGFDHLHLNQVSEEAAFREMQQSRLQLEDDFQRDVLSFAYPFGSTNPQLAEMAKEAGYTFAVNTDQGGLHLADQPLSLFRVNIFPEDGFLQLWKKTSPWYRKYFFNKRKR